MSAIQQREKIAVQASKVRNAESRGFKWDMNPYKCLGDPYGTGVVEGPCGKHAHPVSVKRKGEWLEEIC